MKCNDFDKLTFRRQYRSRGTDVKRKECIGFDTETTAQGNIFLLTDSLGSSLYPENIDEVLSFLTSRKYRKSLNTFFNLRFDSSGILKMLPLSKLKEIHLTTKTRYKDYYLTYRPRKSLSIRKNKTHTTLFFDVAQFYHMSLNDASKRFLGKEKLGVNAENISKYTDKEILDYCIYDSVLCQELTEYLLDMSWKMDCPINKLYSCATLAQKYFSRHCEIPTLDHKGVMRASFNSYAGGRFEVFQRGYWERAYLADISSAYPSEINNLLDLNNGFWEYEFGDYLSDASYAFVRCSLRSDSSDSVIPIMRNGLRIFPNGIFNEIILTKKEFEAIDKDNDIKIEIIDGYYFYPVAKKYPFKIVEKLYKFRQELKRENNPLEHLIKILLNSIYGKFCQVQPVLKETQNDSEMVELIQDEDGVRMYRKIFQTGSFFNPVYASVITANTRMKLYENLGNSVISFGTDSILSEKKLDLDYGNNLGQWKYEDTGETVVIGSGIYSMRGEKAKARGEKINHFRGFNSTLDLFDLLKANKDNNKIKIPVKRPVSIGESFSRDAYSIDDINRFVVENKFLNINFDAKRKWDNNFTKCQDVLENVITSEILTV